MRLDPPPKTLLSGGSLSQPQPTFACAWARRREWAMTHPPTSPVLDSTPSHAALTASDAERIATAIEAELAPSTRQMYAGAWRQWERWCHGRGLNALPASPEALAAFLTERAEAGLTFGTLDGYCSGIAHPHHQEGRPDPTADFVVRRVRRGLRRVKGVAPRRQAHPLTVTEIAQILKRIDTSAPIGIRDRAVILLGYASAMRPGEVSALDVGDIITKPAGILINVRRSKTDQDARGQLVGVARGDNRLTDPIRALDDWLGIRPTGPGALFTRVIYPGRVTNERIGPRAVSRLVQERAIAAGFDGIPVTGHSLRAGHATTAAVNGAPIDRIAAQTRHRDLGTLLNHYIRPAEALATTTSRDLACDPWRAERVGVKGFRPHRLRYTAAHRWLAASGSASGLMAIAGWSRADMLVRYDRARVSERAADEARRLDLGAIRHGPIHPQGSAKLLGEPDENAFRPADVAEPVRVFILDHVTTDQLRTVLPEPGERLVDVVHCEHDAEVPQSVHRGFAVICDNVRREKVREFEPAVAVRRAHHGGLDALVAEGSDTPCPLPFDVGSPLEFEAEFAEELDRAGEVLDDDADIVHPESHLASLWEQQHRDDKMLL